MQVSKFSKRPGVTASKVIVFLSLWAAASLAQSPGPRLRMSNHVPHAALAKTLHLGRTTDRLMTLSIPISFRDEAGMQAMVARVTNPQDELYGQHMTSSEVLTQFGPQPEDIAAVSAELAAQGFQILGLTGNVLKVSANVRTIESTFATEIHDYQLPSGEVAFSLTTDPEVSSTLAERIYGISGLENVRRAHHHHSELRAASASPNQVGTGPGGGLAPADFTKAYGLSSSGLTGTGQTMALFELDGYTASDISLYASSFKLATFPTLQNVLVDGFSGAAGNGAVEVTLDIQLMGAVAPGAAKILVYEGPNTAQGLIDTYAKIANDNLAAEISTSWGLDEGTSGATLMKAENVIFMQMALQGQSMFAAAGDSGAYDNGDGKTLIVDDPSSQPYVTGVGGTTLAVNADGTFKSESSWGTPASGAVAYEGGGGGVSGTWPIPTWQSGYGTTLNLGSQTMRMVPDVSFDANPNTGYAIYFQGAPNIVGGTSCAAPIWAGMMALVNQKRLAGALPKIGFANPALYQIASSSLGATAFHDVADNSTNLHYPALTGYDLSTGWGSPNFANLFTALVNPVLPPAAPTKLAITPHNQVLTLGWTASTGAVTYSVFRATSSSGPFTAVATKLVVPFYVDVNLTNATPYFYYVTAVDAAGASGNSNMSMAAPAAMAPQAPTNLTYTLVTQ